jgi:hypothetical protein
MVLGVRWNAKHYHDVTMDRSAERHFCDGCPDRRPYAIDHFRRGWSLRTLFGIWDFEQLGFGLDPLLLITVKHHLLLCVTPLDEKVQRPSLPVSDTMAYVPFPTFGITSNTQTWDHTPQL